MKTTFLVIVVLTGLGSVSGDIKSFADARKADRSAQFDWVLCGTKFIWGCITGVLSAAGFSAANLGS